MFAENGLITKEAVSRGDVPNLNGKHVELNFGHAQVCGRVEFQEGTRIKLADSDAIESQVCAGLNLGWDSFVIGVVRS